MKKSGQMWILDNDNFFPMYFERTGDQFELHSLQLAMQFVKNKTVAIDGGAHYGSWTRYMAKDFEKVYAFEPHKKIFECLIKNTLNYNNIINYPFALGEEESLVSLVDGMEVDNSGCSFIKGSGNITLKTIDSFNFEEVGFIKLDVEGFEYFALKGAENTLKKYKPIVHLEDKGHSEKYNIPLGYGQRYLKSLGAVELAVYSNRDFIYGWS